MRFVHVFSDFENNSLLCCMASFPFMLLINNAHDDVTCGLFGTVTRNGVDQFPLSLPVVVGTGLDEDCNRKL